MSQKFSWNYAALIAGFAAMITQLVFLRELFTIFEGNEMAVGIILGNWMILMGLGAFLGRFLKKKNIAALISLQIAQALLPILTILLIRIGKNQIIIPGSTIGLTETFLGCFFALLPFCLVAGSFLVVLSQGLQEKDAAADTGKIYGLDNIGGVLGGTFFSFFLIHLSNHFIVLFCAAILHFIGAYLFAKENCKKNLRIAFISFTAALLFIGITINLEKWSIQQEYKNQNLVFHRQSPYGILDVTLSSGQYNFIQNGVPFFSTNNIEQIEESSHYAMTQPPAPKNILLIGGGVMGIPQEILKYHPENIDYVELDPLIIQAGHLFVPENFNDSKIHIFPTDGRLFVQQTSKKYDVIILQAPEPVSFQFNRFYTQEFFRTVQRILNPDGVLSLNISGYQNYMDKKLSDLIGTIHTTLQSVFKNVLIIPGCKTYFIASDGDLTSDIAPRIQNIPTRLVNENYLRAILTPDRLADMQRAAASSSSINQDFNPILYFFHLRYWLSRFSSPIAFLSVLPLIALIFYLRKLNAASFAIFSAGFASSSMEMILLCGFQILYGSLYDRMGIMVSTFMLGMSMGSFWMSQNLHKSNRKHLMALLFLLTIYALLIPILFSIFSKFSTATWHIFAVLIGVPAFLTGMIFPLATKFSKSSSPASSIYGADYIGASLGFLLTTTLLVPLLGFKITCALILIPCLGSMIALEKSKI